MKLVKINANIRCDMLGCSQMAEYAFLQKNAVHNSNVFYCKDCLVAMQKAIDSEFGLATKQQEVKQKTEGVKGIGKKVEKQTK